MKEQNKVNNSLSAEDHIKFDYKLNTPEERVDLINEILKNTPSEKLTKKYLEKMADYLLLGYEKDKTVKKDGKDKILSENRKNYIYEREISLEGLAYSFNNNADGGSNLGEDGIYNLINDNKNILLVPKNKISDDDIKNIPGMKELTETIRGLEEKIKNTKDGKQRKSLKDNIIALYKDRYVLRASHKGHINCINPTKSMHKLDLYENITLDAEGNLKIDANISLLIPEHVSYILCNYSKMKENSYDKFESDIYYMLIHLEKLVDKALKEKHPLYYDLLIYKIDGMQNLDIQRELEHKYQIRYSVEYISSLWRNKIPKLIAEQAQTDWIVWHYTEEEKGYFKKCSRCGQIKLAHNRFFSKNKSSKDNFYSICKECRNKKNKPIQYVNSVDKK